MERELTKATQEVSNMTKKLTELKEDHDKLIETEAAIMVKYQIIRQKKANAKTNSATVDNAIQELKEKIQIQVDVKNDHRRARAVLRKERIKTTNLIDKQLKKLSAESEHELQVWRQFLEKTMTNKKRVFWNF